MSNEQPPPLWEIQEYDTALGFERFVLYFLPQEPPRSYFEAYKRYLEAEKGMTRGTMRVKDIPGSWQAWVYAKDKTGAVYAGGRNWQERAAAWDNHKAAVQRAAELKEAAKFRRKVQKTLDNAQDHIDNTIKAILLDPSNPDQVGRLMRIVYTAALDYFDLRPPERTAEEDRPFNLPTLQEWQAARLAQLGLLADDNESGE